MRLLPLLSSALLVAACTQSPAPDTAEGFRFTCADGVGFSVSYDADDDFVELRAGGESYRLARAVSGSGARYASDGVEFWEHQGEAMVTGAAGGPYEGCRRA